MSEPKFKKEIDEVKKSILNLSNIVVSKKGTFTEDLNNLKTSGLYYIAGKTPANGPAGANITYHVLISLDVNTDYKLQIIVNSTDCYIRSFSGNPLQWNQWQKKF